MRIGERRGIKTKPSKLRRAKTHHTYADICCVPWNTIGINALFNPVGIRSESGSFDRHRYHILGGRSPVIDISFSARRHTEQKRETLSRGRMKEGSSEVGCGDGRMPTSTCLVGWVVNRSFVNVNTTSREEVCEANE